MISLGDQNTGGFSNSNGSPLNSAMIQMVLLASRGVGNWIKLQGTYKKTEPKLNKYQKKYKSIRMQEISYFDQNFVRKNRYILPILLAFLQYIKGKAGKLNKDKWSSHQL